jgi:hypothetical protein
MMKTLCRKSEVVILVAIGVVAILAFRAFAQPDPKPTEPPASKVTFVLRVNNVASLNNPDNFEDVLKHLKTQLYDVVIHKDDGTQEHLRPGSNAKLNIKTDKVTTSKVADDRKPEGGAHMLPGGGAHMAHARMAHMAHMIASDYPSDISTVLSQLKE